MVPADEKQKVQTTDCTPSVQSLSLGFRVFRFSGLGFRVFGFKFAHLGFTASLAQGMKTRTPKVVPLKGSS